MKKVILPILMLFFLFELHAQITIKSGDMPVSGKNYFYSTTTAAINLDSVGGNQTWDYATIKPTISDTDKYSTVGFSDITLAIFFGNLKRQTKTFGQEGTQLFNPKTGAFIQTGVAIKVQGINAPIKYDLVDSVYKLPLNYGDSKNADSFHGSFNLGINLRVQGTRKYVVDAWGTMTTPYGKFDVIRVKTTLRTSYKVTVSGFSIPVPFNTTEYRWLAKGQPYPIMQVVDNGITKTVTYADSARGLVDTTLVRPNFVANDSDVYIDDTVKITNTSTKTNPLTGYAWTVSPGAVGTEYNYVTGFGAASKNPEIIFLKEGKYSISLRAGGVFGFGGVVKTKTDYINVRIPKSPEADFIASTTGIAPGKRVILMDKSKNNPKKWKWEITPNTYFFLDKTDTFSQNPSISFSAEGKYSVKLIATNGGGNSSTTKSDYITVDKTISIEDIQKDNRDFSVVPNPVLNNFRIVYSGKSDLKMINFKIIDIRGRIVLENKNSAFNELIQLENMASGMYQLLIQTNQSIVSKRILVK